MVSLEYIDQLEAEGDERAFEAAKLRAENTALRSGLQDLTLQLQNSTLQLQNLTRRILQSPRISSFM